MKKILLATVAFVFVGITSGFAATPAEHMGAANVGPIAVNLQQLADSDGDGGNGGSGGGDDGADHDSNDDHGGASGNDDDDNDADDDSASKRGNNGGGRKPRVPGGSGCDSAQDRAEHPECNAG